MTREDFLEILFNDLGFDRTQRNRWLSAEAKRSIRYLDDLTGAEQSALHRQVESHEAGSGKGDTGRGRGRRVTDGGL
jgi:hypothetical protein